MEVLVGEARKKRREDSDPGWRPLSDFHASEKLRCGQAARLREDPGDG